MGVHDDHRFVDLLHRLFKGSIYFPSSFHCHLCPYAQPNTLATACVIISKWTFGRDY